MKKVELLAPAKDYFTFIVAIQAGANAVYFAGKQFGARAYATNFSNEEIVEAVRYAHLRDVKIYVTVNTIVYEEEFEELKRYIDFLYNANVDALIVQDLGVINYIRKKHPDFELHLSTQGSVSNVIEARVYKKLGIKRIVLARETPLEVAKEIVKEGIEVEVFVHGALCFAYSGKCLMSYAIGKRSGNRGTCAQPCRKKYILQKNMQNFTKPLAHLSMKDLCTIDKIDELIKANIASFKIEGRMKSPEYVFETVKIYKNAINNYYEGSLINIKEDLNELKVSFNREFTNGYIFNENNKNITNVLSVNHQGLAVGKIIDQTSNSIYIELCKELRVGDAIRIVSKDDIGFVVQKMFVEGIDTKTAFDGQIVKIPFSFSNQLGKIVVKTQSIKQKEELIEFLKEEHIKFDVYAKLKIALNEPLSLMLSLDNLSITVETSILTEKANKTQPDSFYYEKFNKFNDTVFKLTSLEIENDHVAFLSVKDLNEIRRLAIEKLKEAKINSFKREECEYQIGHLAFKKTDIEYEAIVNKPSQYLLCKEFGINNIYTDYDSEQMNLPRVNSVKKDNSLIHHLGQSGINLVASMYLNIVNQEGIDLIKNLNIRKLYLSLELATDQIAKLKLNEHLLDVGLCVYGRYDLMVSKHCMIARNHNFTGKGCKMCVKDEYGLLDEYNNYFPIITNIQDGCIIRIINSKAINLLSKLELLKHLGVNKFLLIFTNESDEEVKDILKKFIKNKKAI